MKSTTVALNISGCSASVGHRKALKGGFNAVRFHDHGLEIGKALDSIVLEFPFPFEVVTI
jgi:hypothetical protein